MSNPVAWPPQYTVRRSQRAKHIGLSVTAKRGLEIVIPTHYKKNDFDDILNEKRRWIEKYLGEVLVEQQQRTDQALPTTITFPAINEQWQVSYITQLSRNLRLMLRPQHEIVLLGNPNQKVKYYAALRKWLQQYSKEKLVAWFEVISQEVQLPYESIIIRGQTTRWGSCSSRKSISLNFKLLFLKPELVRYVMIHELCHTIHLNHSQRFWKLVKKHDPDYEIHKEQLNYVQKEIPWWLEG